MPHDPLSISPGFYPGVPLSAATFALALCIALTGCSTIVRPPADVADPVEVVLLDHGRHTSLALPAEDAGMIRYAYGDWQWYALNQTGAIEAMGALLVPSSAALGRQWLGEDATPANVATSFRVPATEAHWRITVERHKVAHLRNELEQIFTDHQASMVYNPAYGLTFVPHPDSYSYLHGSNHVVADWLQRLGCTITGSRGSSSWQVEQPASAH